MRELSGFLVCAVLAVAGVTTLVVLQRDAGDPSAPAVAVQAHGPAAPAAPSPIAAKLPLKVVIFRPGQGYIPHRPLVDTAYQLRGSSAMIVDSDVSYEEIYETMKALLGDVELELYDLRDR